jgi:exonuclease VII small subunit
MYDGNVSATLRRSSRIPTALPILVTSLAGTHFSEVCETLVVNAHGCAILSPVKLDTGVPLRFQSKEGRQTTAYVVSCQPIGPGNRSWRLGARLNQPENFWGLRECPEDWGFPAPMLSRTSPVPPVLPAYSEAAPMSQRSDSALDRVVRQLEPPIRRMIEESVRPLEAEIAALREKLVYREANPGRFEISLTSFPPELERQVEVRLRKDLEPKVLEESREQYAHLLAAAKATISQRTTESYEDFLQRVAHELKAVERRAQEISVQVSANAQEQMRRGLEDFRQKLLEGGNSLKRLSDELLEYLQQSLNEEHSARRGELEQFRALVASESLRLHDHVSSLDDRIAKLDESVQSLESGLDKRLSRMASNAAKDARNQLESLANEIHDDLTARGVKTVADQLDRASGNMKTAQKEVVASASQSLKSEAESALQAFDHSMNEMAKLSIECWRLRLAEGLNALIKNLGEQFQSEAADERTGPKAAK